MFIAECPRIKRKYDIRSATVIANELSVVCKIAQNSVNFSSDQFWQFICIEFKNKYSHWFSM